MLGGRKAMPRFFINKDQIENGCVTIHGDDAHHVARSLRMAVGEHITVCDGEQEHDCVLSAFDEDRNVTAHIVSSMPLKGEPPYSVILYQALPKGDKLDTIIQKAVECGASCIVPFESEHCVVRMRPDAEERKTERRDRIAHEAAKQSGRGILPTVQATMSYQRMLEEASKADLVLFCYEGEGTMPLHSLLREKKTDGTLPKDRNPNIAIVIGSEGGFSSREVQMAQQNEFCMTGLGSRILRTETASCFVLSNLVYEFEL